MDNGELPQPKIDNPLQQTLTSIRNRFQRVKLVEKSLDLKEPKKSEMDVLGEAFLGKQASRISRLDTITTPETALEIDNIAMKLRDWVMNNGDLGPEEDTETREAYVGSYYVSGDVDLEDPGAIFLAVNGHDDVFPSLADLVEVYATRLDDGSFTYDLQIDFTKGENEQGLQYLVRKQFADELRKDEGEVVRGLFDSVMKEIEKPNTDTQ